MGQMIEVKVSELKGAALDWAVAKAGGLDPAASVSCTGDPHCYLPGRSTHGGRQYLRGEIIKNWLGRVIPESLEPIGWLFAPSADWAQGGPLIERHNIDLTFERKGLYYADLCCDSGEHVTTGVYGETVLIAACRAIVAAHSGETVSVPAELLTSS